MNYLQVIGKDYLAGSTNLNLTTTSRFLWTFNGRNHLRATKTLNIEAFNTHEEFDDYLDQIRN